MGGQPRALDWAVFGTHLSLSPFAVSWRNHPCFAPCLTTVSINLNGPQETVSSPVYAPLMPKSPVFKRLSNLFAFGSDSHNSRPKSFEKSSNSINTLLAYYESNSANGGSGASASNDRLNATSSPEGGVVVPKPRQVRQRTLSAGSTSSSDYSVESDSVDEHFSITSGDLDDAKSSYSSTTTSTNRTSITQKRSNMPSAGGADRRRLAIVQMETLQEAMTSGTSSSESSLRSRRGISTNLAGLALVAPPDASSKTYTHLSPPNTATVRIEGEKEEKDRQEIRKYGQGHHRKEGQHTPRGSDTEYKNSNLTDNRAAYHYERAVRSPSPTKHTHLPATTTTARPIPNPYEAQRAMLSPTSARGVDGHSALSSAFPSSTLSTPLITPDIGAGKEIHVPVAAPVVINLSASAVQPRPPIARDTTVAIPPPVQGPVHGVTATTVFDPVKTSGFVNYKPGSSTLLRVPCLTSNLISSVNNRRRSFDRRTSSSTPTAHRHNFGSSHPASPTTTSATLSCTPKGAA